MFGLQAKDIQLIVESMEQFQEIEKAILFGSRAMGNDKNGSDVDIAIVGNNISEETLIRLADYLNEVSMMPYFFDIVHYNTLSNENLIKHIDQLGRVFYVKN